MNNIFIVKATRNNSMDEYLTDTVILGIFSDYEDADEFRDKVESNPGKYDDIDVVTLPVDTTTEWTGEEVAL